VRARLAPALPRLLRRRRAWAIARRELRPSACAQCQRPV